MRFECHEFGCHEKGRYYAIFKRVYCPKHYVEAREKAEREAGETQTRLC